MYISYIIIEALLSSFPMIPISLVYSFSGMNDSFINEVGVPSVKCQISISAGIGGQYLPQYNMFCYMSYLITEAWLSSFHMIPIALVYSFSGINDSFMNGLGVPSVKCQISISAYIGQYYSVYCSIFCAQLTSYMYRLTILKVFFGSDIDHNDHYYHDPYSDVPRLSLVDKAHVIG